MKPVAPDTILFSSISGQMTGGGQQSLLLLLKNLDRSRFKPLLLCSCEGALTAFAESLDIETILLKTPRLIAVNLSAIITIIKIVKKHHVKIIHADHPRQAFYLGFAARLAGVPMVWHIRVGNRGNRLYERIIYALASKVIGVSHAAVSRFEKKKQFDKKTSVIYNAVDLVAFSPDIQGKRIRDEFSLGNKIVIGTMGQLLPRKGQELFIRAAAEISKTHKGKVRFMIVGAGTTEYTAHLKKHSADFNLNDDILFTGFRTDIPQLLASFDIFTLATTYLEGLSRVLIEAMAAGKPVIATRIGGNLETIVDGVTGILIAPDDVGDLAKAMVTLIDDSKLRTNMGCKGRQLALDRFDITKNIEAIEMIYRDLLVGKDS
jgi:glycosyltransferase involved in cell wall biosynthesis